MRYFFGNTQASVDPALLKTGDQHEQYMRNIICAQLPTTGIVIAHQVHGIQGNIITDTHTRTTYDVLRLTGDFLITDQPTIAIGILTADCVPLFLYDAKKQIIAAVHAGWRGTLSNIVGTTIDTLRTTYNSHPENIYAFIGPHAHACCYEIQNDVIDILHAHTYDTMSLVYKNNNTYCNLQAIIQAQLIHNGLPSVHIDATQSHCTMCLDRYYSARRMKTPLRQINCIALTY